MEDTNELNNNIIKLDLVDLHINRTLHPATAGYIFFSSICGIVTNILTNNI